MSTAEQTRAGQVEEILTDLEKKDEEAIARIIQIGTAMRVLGVKAGLSMAEMALAGQLVNIYALIKSPSSRDEYDRISPTLRKLAAVMSMVDIDVVEQLADEVALDLSADGSVEGMVVGGSFEMGKIVISAGVQDVARPSTALGYVADYSKRNWGNLLTEEEVDTNNRNAEQKTGLIFAIYPIDAKQPDGDNNRIYVITEADRSKTKVLLPSEY